jgi:WhiB family redox-sensing transcriptional regulator
MEMAQGMVRDMRSGAEERVQWRDLAACRTADPDLFFPHPEDSETIERAKAVCAGCPVLEACLAYAVETNQTEGVWGGHTARERGNLRRRWLRSLRQAS